MATNYPGTTEVIAGVFVDDSDDAAIYFADQDGEIVMWTYDEIKEDPAAWVASMMACLKAGRNGVSFLREIVEPPPRDDD
jgi:hypothetical protein